LYFVVIPAKAGISRRKEHCREEIPAFAGMTILLRD